MYYTNLKDVPTEYIKNTNKTKLEVFIKEPFCKCCGNPIKKYKIEPTVDVNGEILRYHVNAYTELNKCDILMTIDHILPKKQGGARKDIENMQTMCSLCNNLKGQKNISNEYLRKSIVNYEKEYYLPKINKARSIRKRYNRKKQLEKIEIKYSQYKEIRKLIEGGKRICEEQ